MILMGNFLYWLMIVFLFAFAFGSFALCKKFGKKFTWIFILTILWVNFLLHFAKQFNPFYRQDFPYSLRMSSGENICAISIMVMPFVFLYGPDDLKDYMIYIGIISGLGVYFFPTALIGLDISKSENLLEVVRFYFCHMGLVVCPFLLISTGLHTPGYKHVFKMPIFFLIHMGINYLNEILLTGSGLMSVSWETLLSRDFHNGGCAKGPATSWDSFASWFYWAFLHFEYDGELYFIPIIWGFFPIMIGGPILAFLLSLPFNLRNVRVDLEGLKQKLLLRTQSKVFALK